MQTIDAHTSYPLPSQQYLHQQVCHTFFGI